MVVSNASLSHRRCVSGYIHLMNHRNSAGEIEKLEARIAELDTERAAAAQRVRELRATYSTSTVAKSTSPPDSTTKADRCLSPVTFPEAPLCKKSPEADRVAFLLSLFHGRRDVYAERFESQRTGKSGYNRCAPISGNDHYARNRRSSAINARIAFSSHSLSM